MPRGQLVSCYKTRNMISKGSFDNLVTVRIWIQKPKLFSRSLLLMSFSKCFQIIYLVFFSKEKQTFVLTFSQIHDLLPFLIIVWLSNTNGVERVRKDLQEKGFIRLSISPLGAVVLLVRKKPDSLLICIDYRELKKVSIKNNIPFKGFMTLLTKFNT